MQIHTKMGMYSFKMNAAKTFQCTTGKQYIGFWMSCSSMTSGGISLENFLNKWGMVWNQMNNDFHANCSEGEYNQANVCMYPKEPATPCKNKN